VSTEPPWPVVDECHSTRPEHRCAQCDGAHEHQWVAWHDAPHPSPGTSVVGRSSGPGIPVRCKTCGGRKCDVSDCMLRRHHGGPHERF
jgi:hypothetical protein